MLNYYSVELRTGRKKCEFGSCSMKNNLSEISLYTVEASGRSGESEVV